MIVESAQLLCTAHRILDGKLIIRTTDAGRKVPYYEHPDPMKEAVLYKASHMKHPGAMWIRKCEERYLYLYELMLALNDEYVHRYNRSYDREHSTVAKLRSVLSKPPENIGKGAYVDPPQTMPDQYKDPDCVTAYRNFYIGHKIDFACYTKRKAPEWLRGYLDIYHRHTGLKYEK